MKDPSLFLTFLWGYSKCHHRNTGQQLKRSSKVKGPLTCGAHNVPHVVCEAYTPSLHRQHSQLKASCNTQDWGREQVLGAAAILPLPESSGSNGLSAGLDTNKQKQLLLRGLFVHNHFITVSSQSVYKGRGVKNPVIPDIKLLGGHHINMMFGNT